MTNRCESHKFWSAFLCASLIFFWLSQGISREIQTPFFLSFLPLRDDSKPVERSRFSFNARKVSLLRADFLVNTEVSTQDDGDTLAIKTPGHLLNTRFFVPLQVAVSPSQRPLWVRLRVRRFRTGQTLYLLARKSQTLASGSLRGSSVYQASWDITRCLGRWCITIDSLQSPKGVSLCFAPRRSQFVLIDKRQQIVELGRFWCARQLQFSNQSPLFTACDSFVGYLYRHLGLPAPTLSTTDQRVVPDEGIGSLRYFYSAEGGFHTTDPCHISIRSQACMVVDNNWGNSGAGPQEHLAIDPWQTYCSWNSFNCSPEDPHSPGLSLLDSE